MGNGDGGLYFDIFKMRMKVVTFCGKILMEKEFN